MMDIRTGHTSYLMFFLVFLNFILISYNFLPSGDMIIQQSVPELWLYVVIFLIFYCPTAIIIGRWHRNTQIKVEQDILRSNDPVFAKMIRILLDTKTGKATKEEIEEFSKFLSQLEKREINEF